MTHNIQISYFHLGPNLMLPKISMLMFHRINAADIDSLKKSLPAQVVSTSEICTVTLKAEREEMKVDIEFKDGSPEITSMSNNRLSELSFDIVCLHR